VFTQSLTLGVVQIMVSFSINFIIVLLAARAARWFTANPKWIRIQKWFMASVLTGLAAKMAFDKAK
jgi:threonine/homoserine/homoserine lactone efflux protein